VIPICFILFRLLHPLSPRGKLVSLGLEGLASTNRLLDAAVPFEKGAILRKDIYRVALTDEQVATLQQTATMLPALTEWIEPDALWKEQPQVLGALRLYSGCKVVHVPTYLRGLLAACQSIGRIDWVVESNCTSVDFDWQERLSAFDTVVLSAGAGLFQNSIIDRKDKLPMQLIRGQSIELSLGDTTKLEHAMLCGKYVSPLPERNRALIGKRRDQRRPVVRFRTCL
jgi:hypothetical protein